jgi:Fur family peroxide stress response transcriptional regulator
VNTLNVDLREAIKSLKDEGVRMTPQRYAVLEYIIESGNHPTADDIYQALAHRFPNMSVATVYNNLRLFTEIGLIQEMSFGDSSSRFDFEKTPHYHAICTECGHIEDFYYPKLTEVEDACQTLTGFQTTHHRMEVYGVCPKCRS